ncbi:MAG: tetratricopeptide repeat protein, partial [Sphingobacteriales bacterium]|nr:tetratricopeptide repeat protein [Sphingobacteriales bacterium]
FVITVIYTNRRNVQWKTQESLVAHDIDYLKNSARANYIYAGMLKNEAMKDATDNNGFSSWEKVRKAEEHYRQALQVYPDYYQAYNMLGSIYFSFYKNHQQAVEYFSKAVQINPSYVPAIGNLAWVYFKMKNFSEAEKYYQLAIKLKPHNPQFKEELNRLYEETGDTTRVR